MGLVVGGIYDRDTTEELVAAGERPCSEFHALLEADAFSPLTLGSSARPGHREWLRLFASPEGGRRLARMADRHEAILAMGETVGVPVALGLAVRGVRRPFFCITHGTYIDNPKFRLAMRLLRPMSWFRLLCLSRSVADLMTSRFGFPPERCLALGVATDTDYFSPRPLSGPGIIASAGVVERDYVTLFRAVEGLDARVEIATNSAWASSLEIQDLAIPPNVAAGPLPMFTGIRNLYAQARFVVLPLNPVPFACGYSVILEAMAMGKAVIASRNPGHSDLLVPGVTGLYVECGDVAALRGAILRLLADPEEAERMGRAGRERVVEVGSTARYGQLVTHMVQSALVASAPAPSANLLLNHDF